MKSKVESAFLKCIYICCISSLFVNVFAQEKPPESETKVKKVLIYSVSGGWAHVDGLKYVTEAFKILSAQKGFEIEEITETTDSLEIKKIFRLKNLEQFEAIIWNNNTQVGRALIDSNFQEAALNYLKQGGGWLIIHGTADSEEYPWPEFLEILGTRTSRHGIGTASINRDEEATNHHELKWMTENMPEKFSFRDTWESFSKSVRNLDGVTVIATAEGAPDVLPVMDDGGDHTYIWARQDVDISGKGRVLFNDIGHGYGRFFEYNDSLIMKLYWENLRYVAGDYQNGCTDPNSEHYDPDARIDDGSCWILNSASPSQDNLAKIKLHQSGRKILISAPKPKSIKTRLHNLNGEIISTYNKTNGEIYLAPEIKPGIYFLEINADGLSNVFKLFLN